jgi:hypothetical protein
MLELIPSLMRILPLTVRCQQKVKIDTGDGAEEFLASGRSCGEDLS